MVAAMAARVVAKARTLREFVTILDDMEPTQADGYLRRGDFSRWITNVFGDHALARELQRHERAYVESGSNEVVVQILGAIRARYELADERLEGELRTTE